ncbi:MAG: DNA cytosine methyltransferase, partial [Bacteroidales bacterium]|nr:DNA cytosine methyltransferase [Bacteroidales bacterium]
MRPALATNRYTAIMNPHKTSFTENAVKREFTFIDLFAGIGGFRIALEQAGGKCVFSSEWNKSAQETYFKNFGEIPYGDITTDETKSHIPNNFDILCGGFPCQPFSICGRK